MPKAAGDAKLLIQPLTKAYAATPTNLKIIDLYVVFAVATALVQVRSVADQHRGRLVVAMVTCRPRPAGAQEGDEGYRWAVVAPTPRSKRSWPHARGGSDHPPHRQLSCCSPCSSIAAPRAARLGIISGPQGISL